MLKKIRFSCLSPTYLCLTPTTGKLNLRTSTGWRAFFIIFSAPPGPYDVPAKIPWGSKLLHACRKLLGNYFSGFQVIITCMITVENSWGIIFRAFQVILRFITCVEFFIYLKFLRNSKNIWGRIFRCIGRLHPPCLPLSCFMLFVTLHECIMKA